MQPIPDTLGGTSISLYYLNERGMVVGIASPAGDQTDHPFLWYRGVMTDLGTFGGDNGIAAWVNDAGQVAGTADFPGNQLHDAFLWERGNLIDLGNLGRTSSAYSLNNGGQVVGGSRMDDQGTIHAFSWDHGQIVDLNDLIPTNSGVELTFALNVNDAGDIVCKAALPDGTQHIVLLVPSGGCDGRCEERIAERSISVQRAQAAQSNGTALVSSKPQPSLNPIGLVRSMIRERVGGRRHTYFPRD
jgi:probable HAF family extracellular repeat protein